MNIPSTNGKHTILVKLKQTRDATSSVLGSVLGSGSASAFSAALR